MLSPKQQAFELLNKSKNILIVLPMDLNADNLGSALALLSVAEQLDKKTEAIIQGAIPQKLSFLPGIEKLKSEPTVWRDFIVLVDTSQNKIRQLRYETEESVLKIFLTSQGKIEQKDIKLEPGQFNYDFIITIGATDLEALGQFYEKYTEIFFNQPVLNIDCRSGNELYGEINLVEPTASSCSEIIADFLNSFSPSNITPDVSTCLLAGVIDATHSFQKSGTAPQAFNTASLLISQGAEKEKIIQALYKTKSLNFLKLWGRLLSRLEWQPEKNLAWLQAHPEDFQETKTSPDDLTLAAEEIYDLLPQLNAGVILWQNEPSVISALVISPVPGLLQKLNLELAGSVKNNEAIFKIANADFISAKTKLENLLNSFL